MPHIDSQNFSTTHSTTSAPSPVPNEHIMNSLSSTGAPISGNEALIGHDSRGSQSQSGFPHTSPPSASHELRVQTSPNGGQLSPLPHGVPHMETPWRSPHYHNNSMNQWPNRLFTTSPPTQMASTLPEYTQSVGQQEFASIQNNLHLPQPATAPIFQPPHGSLRLYNQRVWEDSRGNKPDYWETVYKAILTLQNQYHELVIPAEGPGKDPKYKCGICNQMPNPLRDRNVSQRRWDLSPHILSHVRPNIKPWFSLCGKSYGRSHDQRRHAESCNECKQLLQSPNVIQAQGTEPSVFSPRPTPASRDNLSFPTPSTNHPRSARGTNRMVTQLSGGPSVETRQLFNQNATMFHETVRRADGGHMTHGDRRDSAGLLGSPLQYSGWAGQPGFGETDHLLQPSTHSQPPLDPSLPIGHGFARVASDLQGSGSIRSHYSHGLNHTSRNEKSGSRYPEVCTPGCMLTSCSDPSSLEKGSKESGCRPKTKATYRLDILALTLGAFVLIFGLYCFLRLYLT